MAKYNDQLDAILCARARQLIDELKAEIDPTTSHPAYHAIAEMFENSQLPVGLSPCTVDELAEAKKVADCLIEKRSYPERIAH